MAQPVNLVELKEIKGLSPLIEEIAAQAQCVIRLLPLIGTPIIEKFAGPTTSAHCSAEGRCREIVEKWLKNPSNGDMSCACGHALTVFPIDNRGRVDGILTVCPATPEQRLLLESCAQMIGNFLGLARNAVELWSEHSDMVAAHRELYSEAEALSDAAAFPAIALQIVQKYLKADLAMYLPRNSNGKGWDLPIVLSKVDVSEEWVKAFSTLVMTTHDEDPWPLMMLEENQNNYPQFAELEVSSLISATVLCEKEVLGRLVFCSRGDGATLSFSNLALLENLASTIGQRIHDLRTRKLKERFFESALHQVSTPAHSLLAIAKLLTTQKDRSAKESEQWLQELNTAAERLARLAQKARDFSLLQKPTRPLVAVSLNQVAEDVARGIRPLTLARQISLQTILPEQTYEVTADGEGLYLALQSLVENALKFSPAGGSVRITLTDEGGDYKVSVIDQGPGVPEPQRLEIFRELVSIARPGVPESTGMGLAIAQTVIKAHGGLLGCQDVPGEPGACFWFTIPHN